MITGLIANAFGCVAGVNPPAFVERSTPLINEIVFNTSVAGVNPPAFVERPAPPVGLPSFRGVSPGLIPRPLLSDDEIDPETPADACVAGVNPPAFVERCNTGRGGR